MLAGWISEAKNVHRDGMITGDRDFDSPEKMAGAASEPDLQRTAYFRFNHLTPPKFR